jgi:hypothetical protein
MSRLRNWALNLLLLGCSLAFVVLIAEVAIRYIAPQPTGLSHQDRYGLALHYPNITRYLPQFGHDVTFNNAGMRDLEHPLAKPSGTYRIMVMGDSFMEGLQVPYDSLFSAHLARELTARSGRSVEVINAGVSGWGQDDELRYLTEYGLAYHPDLVLIVMTLHNDIGDNLRQTWHTLKGDTLVTQRVRPMPLTTYAEIQVKAFIATRSQLYQLWRRFRHRSEIRQITRNLNTQVLQLFQVPPPEKMAYGMRLTDHLLGAIRDTVTATGGRMAVVLLPLKPQLSDTAFAALVAQAGLPDSAMQLDRPQAELRQAGQRLNLPVIDLLPDFRTRVASDSTSLYLEWDGHWNSAGHAFAAQATVQRLLSDSVFPGTGLADRTVQH